MYHDPEHLIMCSNLHLVDQTKEQINLSNEPEKNANCSNEIYKK